MAGEALKYFVEHTLVERNQTRAGDPALLTKSIFITDGASQDYMRGTLTRYQQEAKVRSALITLKVTECVMCYLIDLMFE